MNRRPDPDKVSELFHAAVDLPTDERREYLDAHCPEPALRQKVERLLDADALATPGLAFPFVPSSELTRDDPPADEAAGAVIAGRYKLREKVAEGGMGVVWVAEQTRPVRRKVALKLIRAGMDSKTVLSRFAAESQALSLMDHPNIAKVLDGGRAENGRPFFAMEFIPGVPITRYCDDARLSVRERLELFVPVCQAVQHAHQKGIIHRDLKPSNILVCLRDGRPVPKVIDFGLAKAMHQPLTEHTLYTAPGAILGTPLYMSPEQAEFNNLDIDTRTDVYSLGVILYELLTGTTPLEKDRLHGGSWPEVLRRIKDEEPPTPSTRLGGSAALPDIAARRGLEPAKLTRQVRGELDWIVMKALEKDRARRYETASGLALDLQRYLTGEPVLAAPPGVAYRLRKFVRKNRAPVVAAALVFLALSAGVVGTAVGLARAWQKEAETAAVLAFVEQKVFAAARPAGWAGGLGRDVKLIEVVRAALPSVETSFANQPLIQARVRMTFGRSFTYLGNHAEAEAQYAAARRLRAAHLGPDHPDTLESMADLAGCYAELGNHAQALKLNEEVLRVRRSRLGPDHADTLWAMSYVAFNHDCLGHHRLGCDLREEVLRVRRSKLGPDHPDTLQAMIQLAHSYRHLHRYQEAIALYEGALPREVSQVSPDDLDTLGDMFWLATAYSVVERHTALKLQQEILDRRKAKLGPDHPHTLRSMWGLVDLLLLERRGDEAVTLIDEGLRRTAGNPAHSKTLKIFIFQDLRRLVARVGPPARRDWAEDWMTPNSADAGSLYDAACFRSLLAAVVLTDPKTPAADAPRLAKAEADCAMGWLRQAVAAGYRNVVHIERDTDLDALRGRDDFQQLLASLRPEAAASLPGRTK